jgi:hypothetical protein
MRWLPSVLLLACAAEPGADFALTPDPNLNRPEQLIESVDSIVMIVDSAQGLYPAGSERTTGDLQIENADSDPALEVVARIVMPMDRLPVVRLVQGTMPDDVSLDVRFLGLPEEPGAPYLAVGRVSGVHLDPTIPRVPIPFNLRPERLPPRVADVLPSDGSSIEGCMLEHVYVMFSKPIESDTLAGAITLSPHGSVTAARLDGSGLTAELDTTGLVGAGGELAFRIEIVTSVTDREGNALDQVPAEPGPQGFAADFVLSCGLTP